MSAAFKKGDHYQIYVPRQSGGLVQRSTGTSNRTVVRGMQRLIAELRDAHRWTILDAIAERRLTLDQLYRASATDPTLRALESDLATPDVVPLIPAWLAWLDTELGPRASGPRDEYELAVRGFTGESLKAGHITPDRVRTWLKALGGARGASTGYRRSAFYRLRSFVRWLQEEKVLATNPLLGMTVPKKGAPRIRYESAAIDEALCAAAGTPALAAYFALVHATGADVSAALMMRRRDLDLDATDGPTCHVPGTKSARRHRHDVAIEAWAVPRLREYTRALLPNARLFPAFTRYMVAWHHAIAAAAVQVEGYTLRDARHSIAIRMIRAGRTLEDISRQLGSSIATVGTVYAEFRRPAPKSGQTTTVRADTPPKEQEAENA